MSALDVIELISSFVLSCTLLCILLHGRRWRYQPFFTSWIFLNGVSSLVLWLTYRIEVPELYGLVYLCLAVLDFGLQIAVVLELASKVLIRRGAWVREASTRFRNIVLASFLLAAGIALYLRPMASSRIDELFARCNLFMTLCFCFMFLSLVASSKRYGLAWNAQVVNVSYGLASWNFISFATDTLHYYLPAALYFSRVESARTLAFEAAMAYWIAIYWMNNKRGTVVSAQEVLVSEHGRLQFDFRCTVDDLSQ